MRSTQGGTKGTCTDDRGHKGHRPTRRVRRPTVAAEVAPEGHRANMGLVVTMTAPVRYVFVLPIRKVEERFVQRHTGGVGPNATFVNVSLGWFVQAGHFSFGLGPQRPDVTSGDLLRITLERESTPQVTR